jgi:hypothetical protein
MSNQRPSRSPGALDRAIARLIDRSRLVDRGAVLFDRFRSRLVSTWAPDSALDAYNDLAYGSSPTYQAGEGAFRAELFPWEQRAIDAFFPPAPARILIGGAGGGREALQLAARTYEVIAFDPVQALVETMREGGAAAEHITACVGSYETLPAMRTLDGRRLSLDDGPPFAAGICGWASVAHVRTDAARVKALRAMAALVAGPILLSVYAPTWSPSAQAGFRGGVSRWLYGDGAMFLPGIGWVQTFEEAALRDLISRAGLEIQRLDVCAAIDNWPHAVVRRPKPST